MKHAKKHVETYSTWQLQNFQHVGAAEPMKTVLEFVMTLISMYPSTIHTH